MWTTLNYAFYCLILNTIVFRFSKGDKLKLNVNEHITTWKDAFVFCNDSTNWNQIDCQPESCNASHIADRIINKPNRGTQQYWVYGYVLRSPAIVNIGCFELNAGLPDSFNLNSVSFERNSPFKCSRACSDETGNHIFMRKSECICIPVSTFTQQIYTERNNGDCKNPCDGNRRELCGGAQQLYSVYKVVDSRRRTLKVGDTCASTSLAQGKVNTFEYTTCTVKQKYICQRYLYNDSGSEKILKYYESTCSNETASWYDARQKCQEQDMQLQLHSKYSPSCIQKVQKFWSGNHIAEKIVWANDVLSDDDICLKLVITESGSSFETEKCNSNLYSLCYKQHHTSSEKNDEAFTTPSTQSYSSTGRRTYESSSSTMSDLVEDNKKMIGRTTYGSSIHTKSDSDEQNTKQFGRITIRSPVNTESGSDEDKTDFIPIVAGSVGGFVAIVIVVIIVCIIRRRKKSNNKHLTTAVNEREPETYSEPIKNTVLEESRKLVVEKTIPEENTKLVNVTEEGIYNHLGDSEKMIEMKPQDSTIYDVTGDDEYHVFTGNGKQQILKDDDDLYDHGAASDVYNTLNDSVTPNRPESDTYNVINAK